MPARVISLYRGWLTCSVTFSDLYFSFHSCKGTITQINKQERTLSLLLFSLQHAKTLFDQPFQTCFLSFHWDLCDTFCTRKSETILNSLSIQTKTPQRWGSLGLSDWTGDLWDSPPKIFGSIHVIDQIVKSECQPESPLVKPRH